MRALLLSDERDWIMDRKERKYCFEPYFFYDWCGMEQRLTEMAARGWLIEKMGGCIWKYRRCEPAEVRFSINYFSKASELNGEPGPELESYQAYCREAGWQVMNEYGKRQVFYTYEQDAVPIETEPVLTVENIHRVMRLQCVENVLIILLLFYQSWRLADEGINNPVNLFLYGEWVVILVILILFVVLCFEIGGYLRWLYLARRTAKEEGVLLPTKNSRRQESFIILLFLLCFVLMIAEYVQSPLGKIEILILTAEGLVVAAVILAVRGCMMRKKAKENTIRAVSYCLSIVLWLVMLCILVKGMKAADSNFMNDELPPEQCPLLMEDMPEAPALREGEPELYAELKGGWFAKQTEVMQNPGNPDIPWGMHYTVTKARFPWLIECQRKALLEELSQEAMPHETYREIDTGKWQAERVYQMYVSGKEKSTYIVCWKDRIAEITFYWSPDSAQIKAAAEKIKSWENY